MSPSGIPSSLKPLRKLVIISHVLHYAHDGRLFAYGPYAKEINLWAALFPEVIIAAPLRRQAPPGDALPFEASNLRVHPQCETGGDTWWAKVQQTAALPIHLWRLSSAIARADAVHVRCPGNLGLLGCLLAPCFRKRRVAKYAGQWTDFVGQPRSWSWQKVLLRSRWWNAPVLVYGQWPNQPSHVVPLFTSVMDEAQMAKAVAVSPRDWSNPPLKLLFVGRLTASKNVDVILRSLARLKAEGRALRLGIVGDGPIRGRLETLAVALGLADIVVFYGAVSQDKVLDFYGQSHCLVLASETEGWPKAIVEAMSFGLVCIGANRGLVPQILGEGRGLVVEPGDVIALAATLARVMDDAVEAERLSARAVAWARQFTLEGLGEALRKELESAWGVRLGG